MRFLIVTIFNLLFCFQLFAENKLDVKAFGAKGDGKTDDTRAIQLAINAASPFLKTIIYFPAGIYNLASYTTTRNYLINYCLLLHSNIDIEGDSSSQTIVRLADHIFDISDTSANAHLFYGYKIKNISFSNLTIDMNGANNLVPFHVIKNHAAIFTSYGSNYYIHDITIKNCSGTNMLNIMSKGSGLVVENCKFFNGGNYVGSPIPNSNQIDYSFIYSEWDSTIVRNNIIQQQDIDIALQNYTGGIELHGSNSEANGNFIDGCWPAVFITSSNNVVLQNVSVSNNTIINCVTGISFWVEQPMKDISIYKNKIVLTHSRSSKLTMCTGIIIPNGNVKEYTKKMANAAPINNLEIKDNVISADSMQMLSAATVLHSLQQCTIENNSISGMNYAGIILSGSKWGTNSLVVRNNVFSDFQPNNNLNMVAGYIVVTDTYSPDNKDAPGYKGIVFTNNKFLRNKKITSANGKFMGAFIALPSGMMKAIQFSNNQFSEPSEKIHMVKTDQ